MKLLTGMLDEADSGEYVLDSVTIKNLTEKKAAIYRNKFLGFIFQSFNLIVHLLLRAKKNPRSV